MRVSGRLAMWLCVVVVVYQLTNAKGGGYKRKKQKGVSCNTRERLGGEELKAKTKRKGLSCQTLGRLSAETLKLQRKKRPFVPDTREAEC